MLSGLCSVVTHHRKCTRRPHRCLWANAPLLPTGRNGATINRDTCALLSPPLFTMRIRTFKRTRMRARYSINSFGTLWWEVERRGMGFMVEVWRLHIIRSLWEHILLSIGECHIPQVTSFEMFLAFYLKAGDVYDSNISLNGITRSPIEWIMLLGTTQYCIWISRALG